MSGSSLRQPLRTPLPTFAVPIPAMPAQTGTRMAAAMAADIQPSPANSAGPSIQLISSRPKLLAPWPLRTEAIVTMLPAARKATATDRDQSKTTPSRAAVNPGSPHPPMTIPRPTPAPSRAHPPGNAKKRRLREFWVPRTVPRQTTAIGAIAAGPANAHARLAPKKNPHIARLLLPSDSRFGNSPRAKARMATTAPWAATSVSGRNSPARIASPRKPRTPAHKPLALPAHRATEVARHKKTTLARLPKLIAIVGETACPASHETEETTVSEAIANPVASVPVRRNRSAPPESMHR